MEYSLFSSLYIEPLLSSLTILVLVADDDILKFNIISLSPGTVTIEILMRIKITATAVTTLYGKAFMPFLSHIFLNSLLHIFLKPLTCSSSGYAKPSLTS